MALDIPAPYRIRLRFPGLAGTYQDDGATAAFVAELGDHYALYHAFLAARLASFGGRPKPEDFDSRDGFFAAWTGIHDVLMAEAFLRNCRAYRLSGRPLNQPLDLSVPMVSPRDDHLVSVELNDA